MKGAKDAGKTVPIDLQSLGCHTSSACKINNALSVNTDDMKCNKKGMTVDSLNLIAVPG